MTARRAASRIMSCFNCSESCELSATKTSMTWRISECKKRGSCASVPRSAVDAECHQFERQPEAVSGQCKYKGDNTSGGLPDAAQLSGLLIRQREGSHTGASMAYGVYTGHARLAMKLVHRRSFLSSIPGAMLIAAASESRGDVLPNR